MSDSTSPAAAADEPGETSNSSWFGSGTAIVLYIAAAKLLLHLLTANRYGYFGDEMYHMACGEHLDWGYVDQPPLIAVIAWFTRRVLGTSLFAIHLLPALAGAALVWLTGVITRELGGGRFAQGLAALCVACAGVYLVMHRLFTMNAFEPLLWMGCAYLVILIIKTGDQKLWLWFGALAGLGLENKYSMAVFGFSVVVGVLLTEQRKAFASKWIWIGGVVAFLIFLPNLIWNIQHHWPFVELLRNIRASGRDIAVGPVEYTLRQIFLMTPATFPVWLVGAVYFLFGREGRRYRVLGWAFLTLLTTFIVLRGKDYYATPVYPVLLAGGAVAIEEFSARRHRAWLKPALVILLLATTIAMLPIGAPVLSVESYLRYQSKLPFALPATERSHTRAALPHHYAWSFGWEEMTAAVARVYNNLPPEERAKTAIFGNNFAEAGAIDLLGPKYGLPKAIGGHQSYWLWGPRNYTGEIVIVLGDRPEDARQWFRECAVAAELHNPYVSPWENRPVLLCRGLKWPLRDVWPRVKDWD